MKLLPSPAGPKKLKQIYPGDYSDLDNVLSVNVVKMFNNEQDKNFIAFGRVMSGTLHEGSQVKVLTENYQASDGEGAYICTASKLWIMQAGGRHKIQVSKVS
jgi:116 kDa U5 small nuclear ribonucleoprotein component